MRGAKALYLFLSFHFKSQISDLALIAEATNQPRKAAPYMLYGGLLATELYI
ncbi:MULTISPECIES: hypothetical protein [unclassified Carboxylicivirga]|uniref:hypothetical protein n=1 Tax=Carboxylicivirga TaxID=1628153 RepID=UPI003D350A64